MRANECDPATRRARLAKAREFATAAEDQLALADDVTDVVDVCVTLAVHAGIAAADVICCTRLGTYSRSDRHDDAVRLLQQADSGSVRSLSTLLGMKSLAGYSPTPVSTRDVTRAMRAMRALLARAVEVG